MPMQASCLPPPTRCGQSQQDISNRMAAAQGLGANYQQGIATQLSATGGVGSTYASDVARQLSAAGMAQGLSNADYQDIQNLLAAGQAREGYTGQQLQSDIARFNFGQNAPQQNLSSFLSTVYGNPMANLKSTSVTGGGPSTLQNILGGAATLGGLYKNTNGFDFLKNFSSSPSSSGSFVDVGGEGGIIADILKELGIT